MLIVFDVRVQLRSKRNKVECNETASFVTTPIKKRTKHTFVDTNSIRNSTKYLLSSRLDEIHRTMLNCSIYENTINSTKIGFKLIRNFALNFSIWNAAVKNV